MKQENIPEWLDTDSGTPEELANALFDLRGINRRFGGVSTMQSMVEHVSRTMNVKSFTLLEVASGSGYVPQSTSQNIEDQGIELRTTLLDRAQSHLPRKTSDTSGNGFHSPVVGDALALPFADSSFDLVDCNLFAHHLLPDELLTFVNEGLRVCRTAVLINDLVRHFLHLAAVYAALPLFRSRITRHDAPVSVRRAYTSREMTALLAKTRAARIEIQYHYLFRMGVVVWKSQCA